MKLAWIICLFIVICDGAKIRRPEYKLETSKVRDNVDDDLSREISESPNTDINTSVEDNTDLTFERSTRRPLMKRLRFTSKPHAVHYIAPMTHGEQSNFSKKKNGGTQSTHQNKNLSIDSDSVEDRFKTFTDAEILEPNKRKAPLSRQPNRRRGYPLATAASEQFKSVALFTMLNSSKYRTKSKVAFEESLNKIRTIRPGLKEMTVTILNLSPRGDTSSKKDSEKRNSTDFQANSDKLILGAINKNVSTATEITTEKSTTTTAINNIHKLNPNTIGLSNSFTTPSVKLENSETKTANVDVTTKSVVLAQKFDNVVPETDFADHSKNTTANFDNSLTNTEKLVQMAIAKDKTDDTARQPELSIGTANNYLIVKEPVNPADDVSDNSDLGAIKSVPPIVIVTGKSIPTNNSTIEANINTTDLKANNSSLVRKIEDNIEIVTPVTNEAEITTTENNSALRSRRHINVIEEERAATPSAGIRISGRDSHMDSDVSYRNIHT